MIAGFMFEINGADWGVIFVCFKGEGGHGRNTSCVFHGQL